MLEVTRERDISSRVARGSTIERQPAALLSGLLCAKPCKAADPRRLVPGQRLFEYVPMKGARKKPTAAKLRSWRVIIMRSEGEHIGRSKRPIARGLRLWPSSSSSWTRTSGGGCWSGSAT